LTDPSGDAPAQFGVVSPDLVSATVLRDGTDLIFQIRFAPGSFSAVDGRAEISIDTDQNSATGHPGEDNSCTNDAGIIGMDYRITMPDAVVTHYSGCNTPSGGGTATVATVTDGFDVRVALATLGNDDGLLNFKVISYRQLSPTSTTGISDYMSNIGSAPGTTGGGGVIILN
jgi:hypothetical protein